MRSQTPLAFEQEYENAFSLPINRTLELCGDLWTTDELVLFDAYQNTLDKFEQTLFLRLLLRSEKNRYSVSELADRYKTNPYFISSCNESELTVERFETAVERLVTLGFCKWIPYKENSIDVLLRNIKLAELRRLLAFLPDGVSALNRHKSKPELVRWVSDLISRKFLL